MTYLEAVNYLLSQVGSSPVDNINSILPNVVTAKARIQEQLRQVQKTRYWFNVELGYTVPLNSHGELALPGNTVSVISIDTPHIIQRGLRLYDTCNHTYKFTESKTVNLLIELDWDTLPPQAQDVVLYRAVIDHIIQEIEDYSKASFIRDSYLYDAMLELKKTDLESSRKNKFNESRTAVHRFGVRPYGRGNLRPIFRR